MKTKKQMRNLLIGVDEKGHPRSVLEWWAKEAFFTSQEDAKKWSLKVSMTEGFADQQRHDQVSLYNMILFDQDAKKHYVYFMRNSAVHLQTRHDVFDIRYEQSYMKGSYPTYEMRFHDPDHAIEIEFTAVAESFPYWVAQDITHGWLPMGIGFYRYGFIPKTRVSGIMNIQEKRFTIQGNGYFEHVWGSFDYEHPLSTVTGFFKTIWAYKKLLFWWLQNHRLKIPQSLTLSTENNPLGYDWVWALCDNGWSLFYGNALFWVMDGPAAGVLILTKDGKTYTEFSDITFHYKKTIHEKEHDFHYPSELELLAKKGKETLHLICSMTSESRVYIRSSQAHSFWKGLAICEAPGVIKGVYNDGNQTIPLSGVCKIEPQRELSILGHNTLQIDTLLPPQGVGITIQLDSHFFRKKIILDIRFALHPRLQLRMQRIYPSKIY